MTTKLGTLEAALKEVLSDRLRTMSVALGELTVVVGSADYLSAMRTLRDHPALRFEQLLDLCGVDYESYGDGAWDGARFAVVSHLMSVTHNWRLRVRTFAADDDLPVVPSLS